MKQTIKILLFLLLGLSLMNMHCTNCEEEIRDTISHSVELTPIQQTYTIGDTIIISSSFSSMLNLERSGEVYDNSDQSFSIVFRLFEGVREQVDVIPARDNFELVEIDGNVYPPLAHEYNVNVYSDCDEEFCESALGLIPQRQGYFGLAIRNGHSEIDECQLLTFIPQGISNGGNNNFELFEEIEVRRIRIDGSYFDNEEAAVDDDLYFFRVKQ